MLTKHRGTEQQGRPEFMEPICDGREGQNGIEGITPHLKLMEEKGAAVLSLCKSKYVTNISLRPQGIVSACENVMEKKHSSQTRLCSLSWEFY